MYNMYIIYIYPYGCHHSLPNLQPTCAPPPKWASLRSDRGPWPSAGHRPWLVGGVNLPPSINGWYGWFFGGKYHENMDDDWEILVGGLNLPLWKMMEWVIVGVILFPICGKITQMFQTTNQMIQRQICGFSSKWSRTSHILTSAPWPVGPS